MGGERWSVLLALAACLGQAAAPLGTWVSPQAPWPTHNTDETRVGGRRAQGDIQMDIAHGLSVPWCLTLRPVGISCVHHLMCGSGSGKATPVKPAWWQRRQVQDMQTVVTPALCPPFAQAKQGKETQTGWGVIYCFKVTVSSPSPPAGRQMPRAGGRVGPEEGALQSIFGGH